MYHSCSALLPDTRVLVAGSNMHQFYTFDTEFPTELRVEKFSPPYLDPALEPERTQIDPANTDAVLKYGKPFKITAALMERQALVLGEVKVTLLYPPFTTHGFSQNQRMIVPAITSVENGVITAVAPPSGKIAPPGYYIMFVSHLGSEIRTLMDHFVFVSLPMLPCVARM
ncbi:putative galactose oxidase [Tanacetum coccineum]